MIYEVLIGDKDITCTCSFETLSQSMKGWLIQNAICAKCHAGINDTEPCCPCNNISSVLIDNSLREEFETVWSDYKKHERGQQSKKIRKVRENKAEGFFKTEDINAICGIQNGKCFYCKNALLDKNQKYLFEIEHIIPLSDGGTNWPANLSLSCKKCNQKKGSKSSNVFWKILRSEHGDELISHSRAENKKHSNLKIKITTMRKDELTKTYIFNGSPFSKIKKIFVLENIDLANLHEAGFRETFFDLLGMGIQKITVGAFGKPDSKLNKSQESSLFLAIPLLIESIHDFLERGYSHLTDFQKRFEFSELFYEERIPLLFSGFKNNRADIYDFALEETEKDIPEFLEFKKDFLYYLENEGAKDFDKVINSFLKIHYKYSERP